MAAATLTEVLDGYTDGGFTGSFSAVEGAIASSATSATR